MPRRLLLQFVFCQPGLAGLDCTCSATAYLYGSTGQEPFTRAKVRENQPRYDRFLRELFGPAAGNYEGKL